jgi:hypothetical protein
MFYRIFFKNKKKIDKEKEIDLFKLAKKVAPGLSRSQVILALSLGNTSHIDYFGVSLDV